MAVFQLEWDLPVTGVLDLETVVVIQEAHHAHRIGKHQGHHHERVHAGR